MHHERYLQLGAVAVTALGSLALASIEGDPTLAVLVIGAAVVSIGVTDVAGWFRLNNKVAGVLAVLAGLVTLQQALPIADAMSILVIARLLVYLQIILLFQRKDARLFGQLLVLSVLEMMIAAVFTRGATFGLLLLAYLPAALATMSLLFLFREAERFAAATRPARPGVGVDRLWPLAAVRASLVGDGSAFGTRQGRGRDLAWRIATMTVGTLVLTGVAFFSLPRLGRPAWRSPLAQQLQMVGYSGRVELGELGHVIQSRDEVARVALANLVTGQPVHVRDGLYLHGTVLVTYRKGGWLPSNKRPRPELIEPVKRPAGKAVVRQTITVEPTDRPELFHVRPFFTDKPCHQLHVDVVSERLLRNEDDCFNRMTFSLLTTGIQGNTQSALTPAWSRPRVGTLLAVPAEDLPKLTALAGQWAAESPVPSNELIDRARYFERRLRDMEGFRYSLRPQPRDPALDPLDDFVTNNRQGHCEYFASALALMLRSQGIPSRLVVGYCCDEYNDVGDYHQVRQLHAHTWVEAYVPPDQLPPELRDDPAWPEGGWLRLDATPGESADDIGTMTAMMMPVAKGANWLEYVWDSYVMDMDGSRQRKAIYQPLADAAKSVHQRLVDPQWWRQLGQSILNALNPRNWSLSTWFNWRGGLVAMAACLAMLVLWRLVRAVFRAARRSIQRLRPTRSGRNHVEVEFYRRLCVLLGRQGLVRPPGQTPRQFALAAGLQLARREADPELAPLPAAVVDAFYQVRFGRRPLDNPCSEAVEQALARLDLKPEGRKKSRPAVAPHRQRKNPS